MLCLVDSVVIHWDSRPRALSYSQARWELYKHQASLYEIPLTYSHPRSSMKRTLVATRI